MITILLLIVIYITFIGMGLPSSLFGSAFPAIQTEFELSTASANYVTILITGFTVLSGILAARFVNRFGTQKVISVCVVLAALSFFGFSISPNLLVMCLFAITLGLSSGTTDATLNNYLSLHYKAIHFNFMHCFYGIGTIASPYIMSIMLENGSWRGGYRMVFILQCVIALIFFLSFPLWKKAKHQIQADDNNSTQAENLSYLAMFKNSAIRLVWIMCIFANITEGVISIWGCSFLIHAHKLSEASAAGLIIMFFIGMALGRFLSGIISTKLSSWNIIKLSTVVLFIGTVLMFVPVSTVSVLGLFFVGLGVGPIYPNIMFLTPTHFGQKHSASILGTQMAAAYTGFLIGPPVFGLLANFTSAAILPTYTLISNVLFVIASICFLKKLKKH